MALDEIEHECRRRTGEGVHAGTQFLAVVAFDGIRIELEAGIDLTAVAAGCAPTGLFSLQQYDPCALPRQMQRGRQSGDAAAEECEGGAQHRDARAYRSDHVADPVDEVEERAFRLRSSRRRR